MLDDERLAVSSARLVIRRRSGNRLPASLPEGPVPLSVEKSLFSEGR